MILDEDGVLWEQIDHRIDQRYGGECVVHSCVSHPRVTRMTQRPNLEAEWLTTYHCDGIVAQHWSTAAEAIAAMEANS